MSQSVLPISFFDLFDRFVDNNRKNQLTLSSILMPGDQARLVAEGYEEYGIHDEFCLYEKRSMIGFKNRYVMIELQRYFFMEKKGRIVFPYAGLFD